MNRAQRVLLVVGLFVVLVAVGVATIPSGDCSSPVVAINDRERNRFGGQRPLPDSTPTPEMAPTKCAIIAGRRLQTSAIVAGLGAVGATSGALILRRRARTDELRIGTFEPLDEVAISRTTTERP